MDSDASLKLFKWDDPEGKHAFWHSSAHLLAEALRELYPGSEVRHRLAIENGFYYDIDPGENKNHIRRFRKDRGQDDRASPAVTSRLSVPTYPDRTRSPFSATVAKNISANLYPNLKTAASPPIPQERLPTLP